MKSFLPSLNYLRYLIWVGLMLVIVGLVAGAVSGLWAGIPAAIMLAGLLAIAAWLVWLGVGGAGAEPGFWQQRSTEVGTNAIVATLAVLVILGLINFVAVRYGGRIDLTEMQVFTLAPQTQAVVRGLKQPVKVWLFDPQQNPQDRELLESYRRQSSQLSYEYVNPITQPSLAQSFEIKNFGDVYLELGQTRQFVQTVQTVSRDQNLPPASQERLSEVKLTNAIEQLVSGRRSHVYFLQGHGERPLTPDKGTIARAVKSLDDRNVATQPLQLGQGEELPADANVIAVVGAQKPLLESEVTLLQEFAVKGGNLLLLIDSKTDPALDSLLKEWGIKLDDRVAIDVSGRLRELGPAYASVSQYGDHPITKELQGMLSFYPLARPIDVQAPTGVKATPLLFTSDRSWAESDIKTQPLNYNPDADLKGPLILGFALSRPISAPPKSSSPSPSSSGSPSAASPSPSPTAAPASDAPISESRLVVIGSSSFASDGFFDRGVNGDVFLNVVRWLSQQDQLALSIRPKEARNRRLNLNETQAMMAAVTALGILPLLGFGTAIWMGWRRR